MLNNIIIPENIHTPDTPSTLALSPKRDMNVEGTEKDESSPLTPSTLGLSARRPTGNRSMLRLDSGAGRSIGSIREEEDGQDSPLSDALYSSFGNPQGRGPSSSSLTIPPMVKATSNILFPSPDHTTPPLRKSTSAIGRGSSRDRESARRHAGYSPSNSVDSNDSNYSSTFSTPIQQEKLEARMAKMKERFESLKAQNELETAQDEDMYKTQGGDLSPANTLTSELTPPMKDDKKRPSNLPEKSWQNLRRAVATTRLSTLVMNMKPLSTHQEADQSAEAAAASLLRAQQASSANMEALSSDLAEADKQGGVTEFLSYWGELAVPVPPAGAFSYQTNYTLEEDEVRLGEPTGAASYLEEFKLAADSSLVELHRIPESVIQQKREELEAVYAAEQRLAAEAKMREEAELVWREHGARVRIRDLEAEMWRKMNVEKQKLAETHSEREQKMSWQFRRAREYLEEGLKQAAGEIKERYGEIRTDFSARMYDIESSKTPHPIEMRIHLLRAVKNKLAKGAYVLLLTQYDRLGGQPLKWSQIGSYGLGADKPGVTRPIKHYGRYFDRSMKVEDSVYSLCPPRRDLKPSHVFIIELFRLANRRNPREDAIVGWAALPMCLENLGIVEGKYKIPMLKGQHTTSTEHFRDIETAIAADLNNWLCNIYLEVRHLPQSVFQAKNEVSYNFINKELNVKAASKNVYLKDILYNAGPDDAKSVKVPDAMKSMKRENMFVSSRQSQKGVVGGKSVKHSVLLGGKSTKAGLGLSKKYDGYVDDDVGVIGGGGGGGDVGVIGGGGGGGLSGEEDIEQGGGGRPKPAPSLTTIKQTSFLDGLPFNGLFSRKISKVASNDSSAAADVHYIMHNNETATKEHQLLEDVEAGNVRKKGSGDDAGEEGAAVVGVHRSDDSGSDDDDDDDDEVIEKGYNSADDFFLHPEVKGKLAGHDAVFEGEDKAWAKISMDGKVIRRNQSDGTRYDSLAINPPKILQEAGLAKGNLGKSVKSTRAGGGPGMYPMERSAGPVYMLHGRQVSTLNQKLSTEWPPLDSEKEMENYSMAMVQDPAQKKKIIPSEIVRSKLRYLMFEVADGFTASERWTFDFYIAVIVTIGALWIRMFIHFLGEYLVLLGMRVPVYGFTVYPYLISFKYMSAGISVSQEVLVVAAGPLINIAFFLCLEIICVLIFRYIGYLPGNASRFVVSYGFCTVFDPFLVMLVDVFAHNYDCINASKACADNYVSAACQCYEADFLKLWNRFQRDEQSGVVGAIIVVILYMGTFILSSFLMYEYLMHVHKNARILDLWRRITANEDEFLLPHDFEISYEELLRICGEKMSKWRGLDGSTRRLEVTEYIEEDVVDKSFQKNTSHYAIYEHAADGSKKKLYRHFLMLPEGAIIEIFDRYQHHVLQPRPTAAAVKADDDEREEQIAGGVVLSHEIVKSYKKSVKSAKRKNSLVVPTDTD